MAAKKTAAKKATKNTASNSEQPIAEAKIPAGFTQPETGFYDAHDFDKHPIIEGEVVDKRKTQPKKKSDKPQDLLVVLRKADNQKVTVFSSHQLQGLFDAVHIGDEVFIQFQGVKPLPGKKSLKLFATGYKSKAIKPTRGKK